MADYDFFTPLFDEDEESVSDRVFADADDDIDKRPGQIFHDLVMPVVMEMARMWDSVNAMAAVTYLPWSYGPYLDYKGAYEIGITRQLSMSSYVDLTFYGANPTMTDTNDPVFIAAGTQVSTVAMDDGTPPMAFVTETEEVIGFSDPGAGIEVTAHTTSLDTINPPSDVYYAYTLVGRGGETRLSQSEVYAATGSAIDVPIIKVPQGRPGIESFNIYRSHDGDVSSGPDHFYLVGNIDIDNPEGFVFVDVKDEWPLLDDSQWADGTDVIRAPIFNTTDQVTVSAKSVGVGEQQNVPAGSITQISVDIDGVTAVENAEPAYAGQDTESDEDYRERLIDAVDLWQGQGNKDDYARWALMEEAVDSVVVLSAGDLANMLGEVDYINVPEDVYSRVHVVLIGPDNTPVTDSVVNELQILIDPSGWDEENEVFQEPAGHGEGFAPIGARVTVRSAETVDITVNVEVAFETGFTLDGANLTSPTRANMRAAVENYFKQLPGDGDVIWSEVLAAIVTTDGVANAERLEINGATNLGDSIAISKLQVPYLFDFNAVDVTP